MARYIILLAVIVGTSISAWVLKIRLKKKMERGLGRKVDESEMTSISSWMKVPAKDQPYPREKNKYL
jgi:hypothetical protein